MATITVNVELSLSDFVEYAHGTGLHNLNVILDKELDSEVEDYLNEVYPAGATADDINDALAYNEDEIAQYCGFTDWEELEYGRNPQYEEGETELVYDSFEGFCAQYNCRACPYADTPDADACRARFWDRRGEQ